MIDKLDIRAIERISGPAWDSLRSHFISIHIALVTVGSDVRGDLTTIYIKYTSPDLGQTPFAVVWVKKASEIVVGLALPVDFTFSDLTEPPAGCKYAGLTRYFKVKQFDDVPSELAKWAVIAYEHIRSQQKS
jgi:hypothetical protein